MGIFNSKDTRRISFNNTIDLSPAIIQKPVDEIDKIGPRDFEKSKDYNFSETGPNYIELRDEDYDYWNHRIEALKAEHKEINEIIEKEYKNTLENNIKIIDPPKITQEKLQKLKPCFDWRAKILQCYEENPRQPLVCSSIVQAFNNCVSSCHLED